MMRNKTFNIFLYGFLVFNLVFCTSQISNAGVSEGKIRQDSVPERQLLYNGRLWRNLYYQVRNDQFLYSGDFLPGSVTLNGLTFKKVDLRYDIFNDELIIPLTRSSALQLNKEMVDSFSLGYLGRKYNFARFSDDSIKGVKGYLNVLYSGNCALYIKYRKEIELLAVDNKYDKFFQLQKVYFVKNGEANIVSGKGSLMKMMEDHKAAIKDFVRKNKLKMSKSNPETFVPLIRYYDGLLKQVDIK